MSRPFHLLGPSHVGALVATALVVATVSLFVHRDPDGRAARLVERALAMVLLAASAVYVTIEVTSGTAAAWNYLPLHLCDMAIFVAALALFTRQPFACETLVFWAFTGTFLAVVTPDLATDIPSRDYFFYFGLHAGVLVAAAALALGAGMRPRSWAPVRVWLLTNAYAGAVALVNLALDTNYMYLCTRPDQPSPLDWFGPWPVYILVGDLVGLALFGLVHLPLRRPARRLRRVLPAADT